MERAENDDDEELEVDTTESQDLERLLEMTSLQHCFSLESILFLHQVRMQDAVRFQSLAFLVQLCLCDRAILDGDHHVHDEEDDSHDEE